MRHINHTHQGHFVQVARPNCKARSAVFETCLNGISCSFQKVHKVKSYVFVFSKVFSVDNCVGEMSDMIFQEKKESYHKQLQVKDFR
jgi:hypothetical protein